MKKNYLRDEKGRFISFNSQLPPKKSTTTTKQTTKLIQPQSTTTTKNQPLRDEKGRFISGKTQIIPTKQTRQTKKTTQPSKEEKSITSTSKTSREKIQTTNKNIEVLKQNFTFDFNPRINTKTFGQKINYILSRILSQYRNFQFKKSYVVNIRSDTLCSDRNFSEVNIGHNTGNHKCKNILILESVLRLLFDLIKSTSIESEFWIEFIDLTITLYLFPE